MLSILLMLQAAPDAPVLWNGFRAGTPRAEINAATREPVVISANCKAKASSIAEGGLLEVKLEDSYSPELCGQVVLDGLRAKYGKPSLAYEVQTGAQYLERWSADGRIITFSGKVTAGGFYGWTVVYRVAGGSADGSKL